MSGTVEAVAKPGKNAVILNEVSPWAEAGAKGSENRVREVPMGRRGKSLTATRAEAVW